MDACVIARDALGPEDTETIVTQVEDLVKKGFVEEVPGSEHPQVLSPAFLVSKADGGKRMVVDYGKLNKLCAPCALPLPLMEPLLESLAKCKWKSKMDLQNGFWQVRLAERCQKLTSFILPNQAVYRFRVLPMGLAVSPGVFQMYTTRHVRQFKQSVAVKSLLDRGSVLEVFVDDFFCWVRRVWTTIANCWSYG